MDDVQKQPLNPVLLTLKRTIVGGGRMVTQRDDSSALKVNFHSLIDKAELGVLTSAQV